MASETIRQGWRLEREAEVAGGGSFEGKVRDIG